MFRFDNQVKGRILTVIRLVCTLGIAVLLPRILIDTITKKYKLVRYKNSYITAFHMNHMSNDALEANQVVLLSESLTLPKHKKAS